MSTIAPLFSSSREPTDEQLLVAALRGNGFAWGKLVIHLDRYLDEQVFRYNNRATKNNPLNDADRFHLAMTQIAGRRLTFAEVTGKVGETAF